MKLSNIFFLAICIGFIFTSCKNDSEDDLIVKGDPNANYAAVVLNEICGGESSSKDDWVELYNTSDAAVNISGMKLLKIDEEDQSEVISVLPENTVIPAKGYWIIGTSSLSAGISNSKKVTIKLQTPADVDIDVFDRDAELGAGVQHEIGGSYMRLPNGTGNWEIAEVCTRNAENKLTNAPEPTPAPSGEDYSKLVLNELNGNDPKYIELYNAGNKAINLHGVIIKKDKETVYIAPEGTQIAGGGFLLLLADQTDYSLGFTSGLSAKKSVLVELFEPDGKTLIDNFKNLKSDGSETWGDKSPKYNGEETGQSYGRFPDGTGDWYMMTPSRTSANTAGTTKIEW